MPGVVDFGVQNAPLSSFPIQALYSAFIPANPIMIVNTLMDEFVET